MSPLPAPAPGSFGPADAADAFAAASLAANTREAYRSDWERFTRWCSLHGHACLPASPDTLAGYLADAASQPALAGRRQWRYAPSTLGRWVAGIDKFHVLAGQPPPGAHPRVRAVLSGVRRTRATPARRAAPLLLAGLEAVVVAMEARAWPAAVGATRDRALVVMGFVGAFRRSELAGLDLGEVALHPEDGLHVRLPRSKTDQEAEGDLKALPYASRPALCAPCAFVSWRAVLAGYDGADGARPGRVGAMRALGLLGDVPDGSHACADASVLRAGEAASGAVFRAVAANGAVGGRLSGHAINLVVKRRARAAGLPALDLASHSMRAGFVTQAFRAGADAHSIMRQTGHRNPATLEVYAREGAPLVGNAVTRIGL